jgi:hypothetical protein
MTLSLDTPLDKLLSRLKDWIPIPDFDKAMVEYFSGPRSKVEVADYRAKRGKVKKLRDEVTPVWNHISFVDIKGEVRFELNDSVPDCWMRHNSSSKPWGVEVTIAQSREQHHLGQELNEKGIGRGFIGLPDDAPSSAFARNLARERVMYSTESALKTTLNGITLCLKKKKSEICWFRCSNRSAPISLTARALELYSGRATNCCCRHAVSRNSCNRRPKPGTNWVSYQVILVIAYRPAISMVLIGAAR